MKLRPLEEVLLHPEHRAEVARLRAGYAGGWRACLDAVFKETQYTVCDACEGLNHEDGIVCGYCAIGSRNPTAPPAPASPESEGERAAMVSAGDDLHSLIATGHGGGEDRHRPEECEACRAMEAWEKVSPGCAPSCMCLDSPWCPVHRGPPASPPSPAPKAACPACADSTYPWGHTCKPVVAAPAPSSPAPGKGEP